MNATSRARRPQPGARPAQTLHAERSGAPQAPPGARSQAVPHETMLCPGKPDRVDPSIAIGVAGVIGLSVPVVGELEIGSALAAVAHATLARAITAAPALPGITKLISEGLSRNPNGPMQTLQWAKSKVDHHTAP